MDPLHLTGFLESLRRQSHVRWECCLAVTTASPLLRWFATLDRRIRLVSANRIPLAEARGEWVTFADCADELAPDALQTLVAFPDADMVYSDEDRLDGEQRSAPVFKPAWCPVTVRCHNIIGRLALIRRDLAQRLAPHVRGDLEHGLWQSLADDVVTVVHVPRILYHRRSEAVSNPVFLDVVQRPLISIIIPNKDSLSLLRSCIDGIRRSTYRPYETIVVENDSREPETFAYYDEFISQPQCRLLKWDRPFHFAAINNEAVRMARGEIVVFLNNDIEITQPDWLERMLAATLQPGVGAVGAQLFYPDGTLQHGGIVVGIDDQCGHWQRFTPGDATGYAGSLRQMRSWSAVTAACLMMRRDLFERMGGFDEQFAVAFNDIDLCLRLQQQGLASLCTPEVRLIHRESQTRGLDSLWRNRARLRDEVERFRRRWAEVLSVGDLLFNPNLSLIDESVRLELRGRTKPNPRVRQTSAVMSVATEQAA